MDHLKDHNEFSLLEEAVDYLEEKEKDFDVPESILEVLESSTSEETSGAGSGCPSLGGAFSSNGGSALDNWPIQLNLTPAFSPHFEDEDILVAADCVAFATPNFHSELLKDKKLLIGCPKLDDASKYTDKLSKTLESSKNLESKEEGTKITIAYMEVPCCQGIKKIVNDAIEKSGVDVPVESVVIGMDGEIRI